MIISNSLVLGSIFFAMFGIFSMFYGLFMTQIKLDDSSHFNFLTKDDSPWFKPKTKVIFMVIDGLRFDYLLDFENMEHDERLKVNKFKKLNEAFYQDPEKFVVFRAFADFPTLTIMRVPCLMTGNIPQRANIVTAFGPISAKEDSVFRQLHSKNKKTFLAGDLTLFQYFGEYLNLITHQDVDFFDNRNEKIDEVTHTAIKQKIAENDFDFFATHLLRIDHMGHAYSLYDKAVPTAIADVDQLIMEVINSIDDDTIIVFGGDHGMSTDGNHGGALPQETSTAFMAYHKKGFMKYKNKNSEIKKVMRSVNETEVQVRQVDIVPTLSMLAGVPIPFSNMGSILNDLYPAGGDYLTEESCADVAFEIQMMKDNYLNVLQIMNYFEKYQNELHIFNQEEYLKIMSLCEEIKTAFNNAEEMISKSKQCEDSFHEVAIQVVLKSQEFSSQVYELVNFKVPYDMPIFAQGFALLIMVAISYILLVQYIYKTKDYNHINLGLINFKSFISVVVTLVLVWAVMLINNAKIMQPITASVFILGCWILGSSIMFFLKRSREDRNAHSDVESENLAIPASRDDFEESRLSTISLSSERPLFIFERPGISCIAVAIFGFLFYLVHVVNIDREKIDKLHPSNPYIILLLSAVRLGGSYPKICNVVLVITAILCTWLYFANTERIFWSENATTVMGLLLIADWIWSEIDFSLNKMKAGKFWSSQYVICFTVLGIYHLAPDRTGELVQIILPRIIWAIIAGSFLISLGLKMDQKIIKRNLQVYLILFMALLQIPTRILYFAMVLSAMRLTASFFKRVEVKNYLYPIVISFIGYIGLFMLNYTDRKLPDNFGAAFIGLRSFNIVFSLLFTGLSMISTVVLGLLFISFSDQDSQLEGVDLYIQKEELSPGGLGVTNYAKIIKKRNIILYGFLYNAVMISAAIKVLVFRDHLEDEGVMQKFMVDGALYSAVMFCSYFML